MHVSRKHSALPLALLALAAPPLEAQTAAPRPAPSATARAAAPKASPDAPLAFTLTVTPERTVILTSEKAKAVDIAQSLEKALKLPVRMSPLVARQLVTLKLNRVPVEDLLRALAPQVYIDYEVRWERPEDWVGVELTGFNEHEPATPVQPRAFMVIAGSTEDASATEETMAREQAKQDEEKLKRDPPVAGPVLDVSVKDGLVSIRARKQMVTAVLLDVASRAGLGFETRGQLDQDFIDLDVRGLSVDQLPATLARPNFGVLMRRNLTAGETRPVAVLLGTEATKVKK
jgi:hypothetical protein